MSEEEVGGTTTESSEEMKDNSPSSLNDMFVKHGVATKEDVQKCEKENEAAKMKKGKKFTINTAKGYLATMLEQDLWTAKSDESDIIKYAEAPTLSFSVTDWQNGASIPQPSFVSMDNGTADAKSSTATGLSLTQVPQPSPFAQYGWVCPVCSSVWSPWKDRCEVCCKQAAPGFSYQEQYLQKPIITTSASGGGGGNTSQVSQSAAFKDWCKEKVAKGLIKGSNCDKPDVTPKEYTYTTKSTTS